MRTIAEEKTFENKVKKHLKSKGAWFIKYWAGSQFTKKGIPDLLCCVNGYFVAIELKATHGKVSELQKYNIRKINESGGFAFALYPNDYLLFENLVVCLKSGHIENARHIIDVINEEVLK